MDERTLTLVKQIKFSAVAPAASRYSPQSILRFHRPCLRQRRIGFDAHRAQTAQVQGLVYRWRAIQCPVFAVGPVIVDCYVDVVSAVHQMQHRAQRPLERRTLGRGLIVALP